MTRGAICAVLVATACGGGKRVAVPVTKAPAPDAAGLTLAVYKTNFAVVRELREVDVPRDGELVWDRVPKLLDATSVTWRSRTDAAARIRSQTVLPGARGLEELLLANVGRRVVVATEDGEVAGTLLAYDGARLVLDDGGGARVLWRYGGVQSIAVAGAPPAPGTRLTWGVSSAIGGRQLVEVTYQTLGVRWGADYSIVLDDRATSAELAGWATIWNESGAPFPSATVELMPDKLGAKPFLTVGPATLGDDEPVRVAIPTGPAVPATRRLVYDAVGEAGISRDARIQQHAEFGHSDVTTVEEHVELASVPTALPPGNARVYRRRADGTLAWLGQDDLGATEAGKPLRVRLGPAPRIRGTRKQTEYALERERKRLVEEVEITLTNEGDEPREVVVLERLARGEDWKIPWANPAVEKEDTRTIRATVTVPAKGKSRLAYRVIYGWK